MFISFLIYSLICRIELRKLADLHKNVEQKKEKRNIIEDYSNFASKVLFFLVASFYFPVSLYFRATFLPFIPVRRFMQRQQERE